MLSVKQKLDTTLPPKPEKVPVELGDTTCTVCNKSRCYCPERNPDGTWNHQYARGWVDTISLAC